jgi:hypothetical protein
MALVLLQPPAAPPPPLDAATQRDTYAIYAAVLPPLWKQVSQEVLLLQQETDTTTACPEFRASLTGEWEEVVRNFEQENARVRVLPGAMPMELPYRLIPRAEILADAARLAEKYPGIWQRRPGSLDYAAVTGVGFNAAKTKAMLHVRVRGSGDILRMELNEGKWIRHQGTACGWII